MSAEGVRSGGNDSGYRRRMARGAAAGVLGLAAGRAASFVTVPVFLHLLGVRLYGVWVVATVLIGSQGLLDLGMATATVKHMAEAHELDSRRAARGILVTSFVVYAVLSAAFALLVAVLLPHIPGWLAVPPELGSRARVLLAGAIPLYAISNVGIVLSSALQGLQRLGSLNAALVASQVPFVACALILRWAGWEPERVVVGSFGALYVTQVILYLPLVLRRLPRGDADAHVRLRAVLAFGLRTQLIASADFAVLQLPRLVAGIAFGAAAAGRLDLAMRLPQLAAAVVLPLLPPLMPATTRLRLRGDRAGIRRLHHLSGTYAAVVALPAFAALVVWGSRFLVWWVGPAGSGLGSMILWLSIGFLFHALTGPGTAIALGDDRADIVLKYKGVLLVVVVPGVLGIGAAFGNVGTAAGIATTLVAGSCYLFASLPSLWSGNPADGFRPVLGPLLALALASSAGAALAGLAAKVFDAAPVPVAIWLSLPAYAAVLICGRVVNLSDLRSLR